MNEETCSYDKIFFYKMCWENPGSQYYEAMKKEGSLIFFYWSLLQYLLIEEIAEANSCWALAKLQFCFWRGWGCLCIQEVEGLFLKKLFIWRAIILAVYLFPHNAMCDMICWALQELA